MNEIEFLKLPEIPAGTDSENAKKNWHAMLLYNMKEYMVNPRTFIENYKYVLEIKGTLHDFKFSYCLPNRSLISFSLEKLDYATGKYEIVMLHNNLSINSFNKLYFEEVMEIITKQK